MASYKTKYRTYDQLLAEVKMDFPFMDIDPQDYIKHVKFVNSRLGLRIQQNKQRIIEITNGRGILPSNFDSFNGAYMIQSHTEIIPMASLTHDFVIPVPQNSVGLPEVNVCIPDNPNAPAPIQCDPCKTHCSDCSQEHSKCYCVPSEHVRIGCNGDRKVVLRQYKNHVRTYSNLIDLELVNSPEYTDDFCFKKEFRCNNQITIRDGFVFSSIQNGQMYLNYQSLMEDDEGNLLVLDHDQLNMYYEYYLKSKCLERCFVEKIQVDPNLVKIIYDELRRHRISSESIMNLPEFDTIRKAHQSIRKAFYIKYYRMFSKA